MQRTLWTVLWVVCVLYGSAQNVLHYTATSGFDHGTREVSFEMFESIGMELGINVDDDSDGASFSVQSTLDQYAVIIFSNTSGDALLDGAQRANFEDWVANGGRVLGVHAATDTYRHSSANGANTGTWDFYPELIGGSVQVNPNHVSGTPEYDMEKIGTHASTTDLPDPWTKNEEYYYWEGGYYGPDNTEVLRVEETIGPNGQVNTYDAPRPMSWYRILPSGSKVFYTALGHAPENFNADQLFRTHITDALTWLLSSSVDVRRSDQATIKVYPNPCFSTLIVDGLSSPMAGSLEILDPLGRIVSNYSITGPRMTLDLSGVVPGSYQIRSADRLRMHFMVVH